MEPVAETNQFERRFCMLPPFLCAQAGQAQRKLDVFQRCEHRNEIEGLEHKSNMAVAPPSQLPVTQPGQIFAKDTNLPGSWPVHGGNEIQESRLTRA